MGQGIIALLSNLFGMAKSAFGFQSKKLDLRNTSAMQTAAAAQSERNEVGRSEKAVAARNVDEVRNEISE